MKKSIALITWVLGMLLTACSSIQTISFDQLQAGDVSFPNEVRKVAIVNNMPVIEPENTSRGVISPELEGDGKIATEHLAENVANVNYFDQVIICDSAFRATDTVPRANVVLTKEEVDRLAEELGVDMILSFDRLNIQTRSGVIFYSDYPLPVSSVDAVVSPVIRAYVPQRDKPLFAVAKQDTISWDASDPQLSDKKIVAEASEYAAFMPIDHLLPHWNEVLRPYFDGGCVEMRDAGVCLRENDWDGARDLWQTAYEKRKGQQKMKAAFNLALYYEMKDDIARAKEWLRKAEELAKPDTFNQQLMSLSRLRLDERESKLLRLHIQMTRFEDNFGE